MTEELENASGITVDLDLDLDAVARPDLYVKLGERVWAMPGGPRSETVVDLAALFQQYDKALNTPSDENDRLKQVSDEIRAIIVDTFAERNDVEDMEEFPVLDDEQLAALFKLMVETIKKARLERLETIKEVQESVDGTDEPRPTGQTSTPKRKSGARSSRSSGRSKSPRSTAASSSRSS